MARRGRTRKRHDPQLEAAMKTMTNLSFPEKLVRDTVDELLEIYGGDDGWVFIQDDSYSVLIDTLFEKQHNGTKKQDQATREHGAETPALVPPSSRGRSATCTPMEVGQSQADQPLNSLAQSKIPDSEDSLPSKRRRPYHGWIGNDDEDPALVQLKPAPLAQGLNRILCNGK